jgi:4-carboxymuconolactone decarboxylase
MTPPRFLAPDPAALDDAQRRVYDATRAGRRGTVPANVLAWLPSPELAQRAQHLGAFLRYDTSLGPRLSELAILAVARRWSSAYEWAIHAVEAERAGVPGEVIAAIASGASPALEAESDQAVYDVARELPEAGQVSDATFARAEAALGRATLVELVGLVGYYSMVAMTLNAFQVPPPAGAPVLPPAGR